MGKTKTKTTTNKNKSIDQSTLNLQTIPKNQQINMMMSRTLFFALLATTGAIASTAGKMTMWSADSDVIVGGSCEYANSAQGGLNSPAATSPYITSRHYCAVSSDLYGSGLACGRCYRVTFDGTDTTETTGCAAAGSAIIQVVDSGSAKEFDCQETVFQEITGCTTGVMGVSYEEVECEGTGPATATVLECGNAWYTKMIFSGLSRAVSAASIMIEGQSEPIQMNRNGGATWSASTPEAHSGNVDVTFTLTLDNQDTVELADCFTSWPQSTSASCTATSPDTDTDTTTTTTAASGSSNCGEVAAMCWQRLSRCVLRRRHAML